MISFVRTPASRPRVGAILAASALVLAACGSDTDESEDADTAAGESAADDAESGDDAMNDAMGDDAMGDMDHSMMDMNMGDVNATPADEVDGAALARGEFALLDTRPAGYDDLAGTAVIARHAGGTTVTTEMSGLLPNVDYISHVHEAPCADSGGDHFQFVDGPIEVPPNEIHLAFTSDNDGNGFMTAENDAVAGLDAVAFVIHPSEFIDNKIACVDFVPDEGADLEAAVAAGPAFDESVLDDTG
ncbi:MAG: superoxide dismutase family protein [Actinomycetota bacterium]